MKTKAIFCIVTFPTTAAAMAFEKAAKRSGLSGRLIPTPRSISTDCGLAWKDDTRARDAMEELVIELRLDGCRMHEVAL
ncbi:MAG: DUF3343 domain-containing protein [Clostridiales Family XIII bacterium]|jgi:hypothetical protein|nr:DUF3343 domain-containing protein [Clostridiales Family XIII bacterium]